jgi:hypothetical protein
VTGRHQGVSALVLLSIAERRATGHQIMPPTRQYVGEFVKVRVPLAGAYSNPNVQDEIERLHCLVAKMAPSVRSRDPSRHSE